MSSQVKPRISSRMNGYTTRQLEKHINWQRWNREEVSLEENGKGLFWQGQQVHLRRFPMYLAPEDPRRKAPFLEKSREEDAYERDSAAKQVWLPYGCFYRSPGTKGRWISLEMPHYITLCDASAWVLWV